MLQELEMISVTPRETYDLVSLWAELRMVCTFCCGNQATCTLCIYWVTTVAQDSLFTMPEKIDQDKEMVLGIVLRGKRYKSGIPFENRRQLWNETCDAECFPRRSMES